VKQRSATPLRRGATAVIVLLAALACSRAAAQTAVSAETVIVLQPTAASPAVRRSLARIRDELTADRFRVVVADASPDGDAQTAVAGAARDADADIGTVLTLFGDPEAGRAELCVVRRSARRLAVRRAVVVADDPERMPEALATRALELLRATALELSLDSEQASRAQHPLAPREAVVPARLTAPGATSETSGVVATMGIGVWTSVAGPPPAVAPVARVALRLSERLWARVSVAGLGSRPRVETPHGSATLAQSVALAELAAVFRGDKRLRLTSSLGAGAVNVAVVGTGVAPYEGREPQQWSAAFDAGLGAACAIGARAALITELHALIASPHTVVRFVDARAATVGYPSLMWTLALAVTL